MPPKRKYSRAAPRRRSTYRRAPYKRRATGARLSKAAWMYGKMYDRTKSQARLESSLAELGGMGALSVPQDAVAEANNDWLAKRVTGRGAYNFGRNAQKFLNGRLGGSLKNLAIQGAMSAGEAMSGMGMYTGSGAYSGNNLVDDVSSAGAVPSFGSVGDETGAVIISHREYISDVYANPDQEDFKNVPFAINPGLEATFPWLSQLAQNFEEYEVVQLMFTFRSTMAEVSSTNGQVGTIIMATNYNAAEGAFKDKARMMGYAHSSSDKVTAAQIHGVECDPAKNSGSPGKYVRNQGVPVGEDIKTYDHATFQLAVANTPSAIANQTIGELWVSYTVILRKPLYYTNQGLGIQRSIYTSGPQPKWSIRDSGMFGLNASILKGQANSIDCLIEQTISTVIDGDPELIITFPAAYAGNLEVRLTLMLESADIVSSAPSFWIREFESPSPSIDGNVSPIRDIYLADQFTATVVSAVPNYAQTFKTDFNRYTALFHVRTDVASFGKNNRITIKIFDAPIAGVVGGMTSEEIMLAATLNIAEYNQSFGTSTDPRPILVDSLKRVIPFTLAT